MADIRKCHGMQVVNEVAFSLSIVFVGNVWTNRYSNWYNVCFREKTLTTV